MSTRIALVTGSQQGIGLAIVRALCRQLGERGVVYLTALEDGPQHKALDQLKTEGLRPRSHILDVTDRGSIEGLRDRIMKEHGGLDILVNNAAVAYKDDLPMSVQAEGTMKVNFFGALNMTKTFLPLIRDGGRIVQVASRGAVGAFYKLREDLQIRFREASSEQQVINLMNQFLECTKRGDHTQNGWADWAYGTSKLGLVTMTRIHGEQIAKDTSKKDILINCCHPGYVDTSMTAHHSGERTKSRIGPDEGADTPVFLALLPPNTTGIQGEFLAKRQIYNFFKNEVDPANL